MPYSLTSMTIAIHFIILKLLSFNYSKCCSRDSTGARLQWLQTPRHSFVRHCTMLLGTDSRSDKAWSSKAYTCRDAICLTVYWHLESTDLACIPQCLCLLLKMTTSCCYFSGVNIPSFSGSVSNIPIPSFAQYLDIRKRKGEERTAFNVTKKKRSSNPTVTVSIGFSSSFIFCHPLVIINLKPEHGWLFNTYM